MAWNLYENGKFLKPLVFSNGKTQEDVVQEVMDSIKGGHKVIFIHGKCGTGKSAIALNIAKELGKSSIVVPSKALQQQYKKDYEENKYLLKNKDTKLKIPVITGRNNHPCKFLADNKNVIPSFKKEVNSKLYDIFEGKREKLNELIAKDLSADNKNIPCKIEIKEKNFPKIKEYLKQNKKVNPKNFQKISDVKRLSIAPVCPYWSPVVSEKFEIKNLEHEDKKNYLGLEGKNFIFYRRKPGCPFYEQFNSYIDSDIIVFNSLKYKLESLMNRKPSTEVEIIDECDEFLDDFSNKRNINIDRLQNSLNYVVTQGEETFQILEEINKILGHLKRQGPLGGINNRDIVELRKTGLYDLFKIFLKNSEFMKEVDEESYVHDVENTVKMFEDFLEESYVIFERRENNLIANIVTINLAKKFKEMVDKNKIIVLMSGTLHSNEVLREIFGIEKFKIIEAETKNPGKIKIKRIGGEMDCKYSNFASGKITREEYLKVLDKCVNESKKPVLVHVNSFKDLPDEFEKDKYDLNNLISREKLLEIQREDKEGRKIREFKAGHGNVLFSTKCSRGIDFPGDECKSIIFTKFPNPNVQDAFWKILNKTNPSKYWCFYRDKARRELLQKIYRGLRFEQDEIFLMSPDSRILDFFDQNI